MLNSVIHIDFPSTTSNTWRSHTSYAVYQVNRAPVIPATPLWSNNIFRRRHWITWSTLYSIACMIYICFLINAAKYLFIHSSWFTIILDWTGFYRIDVCRKMYEFIRYIYCLTAFQSRHTIRSWAQPHRLTPNGQLINLRTKKKCRIFCGRGNSFFVYF